MSEIITSGSAALIPKTLLDWLAQFQSYTFDVLKLLVSPAPSPTALRDRVNSTTFAGFTMIRDLSAREPARLLFEAQESLRTYVNEGTLYAVAQARHDAASAIALSIDLLQRSPDDEQRLTWNTFHLASWAIELASYGLDPNVSADDLRTWISRAVIDIRDKDASAGDAAAKVGAARVSLVESKNKLLIGPPDPPQDQVVEIEIWHEVDGVRKNDGTVDVPRFNIPPIRAAELHAAFDDADATRNADAVELQNEAQTVLKQIFQVLPAA